MLKHETQSTCYWITWGVNEMSLLMKFGLVDVIYKIKVFIKKFYGKCGGLDPGPFLKT